MLSRLMMIGAVSILAVFAGRTVLETVKATFRPTVVVMHDITKEWRPK